MCEVSIILFESVGMYGLERVAKLVLVLRTAGLVRPRRIARATAVEPNVGHNEPLPRGRETFQASGRRMSKV